MDQRIDEPSLQPGASSTRLLSLALDGDDDAFDGLVQRYQNVAVATAYGKLGDLELARDATQEAFLDAHQHLAQLRQPEAFAAWLRTIVNKHCDRITRRKSTLEGRATKEVDVEGPEPITMRTQDAGRLRLAVDALPAAERQAVALCYFADLSGHETARYLNVPLSTVKQRLRSARARLRQDADELIGQTLAALRPSQTPAFTRTITFFIALRGGNRAAVARLLKISPELADATQTWDQSLVSAGLLPFANRATALITAIELNDRPMLRLLLDAGANVEGQCGCATGETPLWAATLLDRTDMAEELLARGADPNTRSASGNCPLHLAAMRGRAELVALLLNHGADPAARDDGVRYPAAAENAADNDDRGRTPADWALANGFPDIAARIAGHADSRVADRESKAGKQTNAPAMPQAATPAATTTAPATLGYGSASADSVPAGATPATDRVVLTGIKALDLFAPLPRGGLIRVPFIAGAGMVVLLGELCERYLRNPGGAALWTGFAQPPFDLHDWRADMSELGLTNRVVDSLAGLAESDSTRRDAFQNGIAEADRLCATGHDVLVVVLSTVGFEADTEAGLARLAGCADARFRDVGSVTTLVVTPAKIGSPPAASLPPAPFSAQISLDRAMANRQLLPAIDERLTSSTCLSPDLVGARHVELAARVRSVLGDCRERNPELDIDGDNGVAARVLRYLRQPFFTTEPFTGNPGEFIAHATLVSDLRALLNGSDG